MKINSELLQVLIAEQKAMRADVRMVLEILRELHRAPPDLEERCRDPLQTLGRIWRNKSLTAGDIIKFSRSTEFPQCAEVREAVLAMVGELNAKKLGNLFASIKGKHIGGLRVVQDEKDPHGNVWRLERVPDEV